MTLKLMTSSRRRMIQILGMGVFFSFAFIRLRENDSIHPSYSRYLESTSNGTIMPSGCEAKMAAFYGDQCVKPYCENLVGGFINYFKIHSCDLADVPALSYTILVSWLLVVFWLLADTADSFFVPILQQIVILFKVQPALAGITFLSFGNGAPDVFATIASFSAGGDAADIGIGSLLGSGMFVTTVVLALVAFQSDGRLKRRPFVRDIICYLATLTWLMYIVYSEQCTCYQALVFVGLYICFVLFVIGTRKIYLKYYKYPNGGGTLDEALLNDDELELQQPTTSESKDDEDQGDLWGWDGGLRLKLRAKQRASVAKNLTHEFMKGSGRDRRSFQSLTAAEYSRRLERSGSGSVQRSAKSRRIRAASYNLDGSDNYDLNAPQGGIVDDLADAVQHSIDRAGGWADAASKVNHHAEMGEGDEGDEGDENDAATEPSFSEIVNGLLSDAAQAFVDENLWGKFTFIICAPLTIARRLSIPILGNNFFDDGDDNIDHDNGDGPDDDNNNDDDDDDDDDDSGYEWSKTFAVASFIFLPLIGGLGTIPTLSAGPLPVWVILLLLGLIYAGITMKTTSHNYPPRSRCTAIVFLVLGFLSSILWIYFIANELVTVLQVLGILLSIPNSVLGLTVLAWANSAPDTISIVGVAKQGYVQMAIGGVYAGRMFDTLCGLGLGLTVATLKSGISNNYTIKLHPDKIETLSFATLLCSVVSAGIIVPLSGFKYTKPFAVTLLILYIVFLVLGILVVAKVIVW